MTLFVKLVVDVEVDVAVTESNAKVAVGIVHEKVHQALNRVVLDTGYEVDSRVDGWEVQ